MVRRIVGWCSVNRLKLMIAANMIIVGVRIQNNNWQISYQGQLKHEVMVFMQDLQDDYGISLKAQPDHFNVGKDKVIRL